MALNKSIYRYTSDTTSKRVIYESIGTRLFYLGEDVDENVAIKKCVTHAGRYIIKNGRGRVLARIDATEKVQR